MSYNEVLTFVSTLAHGCTDQGLAGFEFTGLDYAIVLHAVCPHAMDLSKMCWVPQCTPKQLDDNLVFFLDAVKALDATSGVTVAFPGEIETRSYGGARRAVPPQPYLQQQQQQPGIGGASPIDGDDAHAKTSGSDQTSSSNVSSDTQPHPSNHNIQQQQQQQDGDDARDAFSLLLFTPDTLQPTKQCFMHHMQVQQWLFLLGSGDDGGGISGSNQDDDAAAAAAVTAATAPSSAQQQKGNEKRARILATVDALAVRRRYAMPVPLSQRCPLPMQDAFELIAGEKQGYRQCWRELEKAVLAMLARDAEVDMRKLNNILMATQPTKVL